MLRLYGREDGIRTRLNLWIDSPAATPSSPHPDYFYMVPKTGVEPARYYYFAPDSKSGETTNSSTWAYFYTLTVLNVKSKRSLIGKVSTIAFRSAVIFSDRASVILKLLVSPITTPFLII